MSADDVIRKSNAPDMWGIDPDEIYHWTPKAGRKVLQEGIYDIKEQKWTKEYIYGEPLDGAPVIDVQAMPEKIAMKLANAKTRFIIAQSRLLAKAATQKKADTEAMIETLLDKIDLVYTPDLISEVLRYSIVGWSNVRSPKKELKFEGNWDKDARKLPQQWQAELFSAIVDDTLYRGQEDSFTSVPNSSADSLSEPPMMKAPTLNSLGKD